MTTIDRYGKAIEQAISMIRNDNVDPTTALLKTAESAKLSRPAIEFVATQLNNSRALAHMFQTSGADRLKPFPLADASVVVAKLASSAGSDSKPTVNPFTKTNPAKLNLVPKTAKSEIVRAVKPYDYVREFHTVLAEERLNKSVAANLHKAYSEDVRKLRNSCSAILKSVTQRITAVDRAEQAKYGRRIVNRFPDTGRDIVGAVYHCAGVDVEVPIRTSNEAVLPAQSFYSDTVKLQETVAKLAVAETVRDQIVHVAGNGFMEDFLANSAALGAATKWLPASALSAEVNAMDDIREFDQMASEKGLADMSPETAARLSGLRTRRTFMDAVLNDPNLRGYPLSRLARAFNDSVQTDPSIVRSPPRLRAGMTQMLQSSVLDPFQLGQMVDTGKKQQGIFKELRSQKELFQKEVGGVGESRAGRYQDMLKAVNDEGSAQAKVNADSWKEAKDSMVGSIKGIGERWGKLKEERYKAESRASTKQAIESMFKNRDQDMLQQAANDLGFSDVEAMKTALINDASNEFSKSVLAQKSPTENVSDYFAKQDKALEGEEKKAAREQQLADNIVKARLDSMGTDEYARQAAMTVEAEMLADAKLRQDKDAPITLKELATKAMSVADVRYTGMMKDRMEQVKSLADANRLADNAKTVLSRNGTAVNKDEIDAFVKADLTARQGLDVTKLDPLIKGPAQNMLRNYESSRIETRHADNMLSLRRAGSMSDAAVGMDALERRMGLDSGEMFKAVIAASIPDKAGGWLAVDPVPTLDSLRAIAASNSGPDSAAASAIIGEADRLVKEMKAESPLIFTELQ